MKRMKLLLVLPVAALLWYACQKSKQEPPVENDTVTMAGRTGSQELEEHIIPLSLAKEYSQRFLRIRDTVLPSLMTNAGALSEQFNMPLCETFNREAIDALMAVNGTQALRIYLGVDAQGQVRLVLLPVDDEGNNIITTLSGEGARAGKARGADEEDDGDAVENGHRPPPYPEL